MLRGRRLPVPQSTLPGWRATTPTTPTTTARARARARCVSSTTLRPDDDGGDHAAPALEENEQATSNKRTGRRGRGSARRRTEAWAQDRTFRKYVDHSREDYNLVEGSNGKKIQLSYYWGTGPPLSVKTKTYQARPTAMQQITRPGQLVFRKLVPAAAKAAKAAVADQARASPRKPFSQHVYLSLVGRKPFQGRGTSEKTDDDSGQVEDLKLPLVTKDPAASVSYKVVRTIAMQLGIDVRKRRLVFLKRAVARRLGFRSWVETPATVQAATEAPTKAVSAAHDSISKATRAKVRQAEMAAEGKPAPFPQRDYGIEFKQPFVGDMVMAPPRNPTEPVPSRPMEGPTLNEVAAVPPRNPTELIPPSRPLEGPNSKDGFLVGKNLGSFFSQSFGANKPRGVRFSVLPTWVPWGKAQAADTGPDPKVSKHPLSLAETSGALIKDEAERQQPSQRQETGSRSPENSDQPSFDKTAELAKPAQNKQSIFDMLFAEKKRRPSARLSVLEGDVDRRARTATDTPVKPRQTDGSIYRRLFPEEARAKLEEPSPEPTQQPSEPLKPPDESLFVSLRNEVRNWIPENSREETNAPEPGEYGSQSTVVVLSGVSDSLVDTDFYRIIPEGKYVEGWAGGLVKVVQARDPLTHEPAGQYFLMFHSRPAAVAYAEEVKRLLSLSQRLLHVPGSSGRTPARGALERAAANPQPLLTDEERTAARSFTLCAPSARPRLSVRMWGTEMAGQIASKTDIADVVQALRPEAETAAKVLLTVTGHGSGRGRGLTAYELWLTLRDDGLERGTPWALKSMDEGIMPLKSTSVGGEHGAIALRSEAAAVPIDVDEADLVDDDMLAESGVWGLPQGSSDKRPDKSGDKKDVGPDRNERFNRFILTFTQLAVARRFVRSWHKRAIWDATLRRSVVIDAVALM